MQELAAVLGIGGALIGGLFALVGILCAIWGLASANVGVKRWRALAERYPVRNQPTAEWKKLEWLVAENSCRFRGCGKLVADENYLWIMPPAIFSAMIPPVQIPWDETSKQALSDKEFSLEALGLKIRFAPSAIPDNTIQRLPFRKRLT
jgi:hypothetical protein